MLFDGWMFTTPTLWCYCPCNGFSFFVFRLSRFIAYSPSLFLQQQLFAALSSDNDSFSLPSSVSIPLFHCLFTSLRRSMQHHSFSSGIELLCLLSASLSHSSSRLAITAYLLSPSLPPLPILQGTSDPQCVVWDYGNP